MYIYIYTYVYIYMINGNHLTAKLASLHPVPRSLPSAMTPCPAGAP